jgi:serine protease Do
LVLLVALAMLMPGGAAAQDKGFLGLNIRDLEKAESEALGWEGPRGAMVSEADPALPAGAAGVLVGDVVVSVDGTELENARSLAAMVSAKAPGAEVSLRVLREGKERRIKVVLGTRPASLDQEPDGKKCSKYMPSVGKTVEVPCGPDG